MRRYWWLCLLLVLVACGGPVATPTANLAPTQTRAAELAQLATLTVPIAAPTATAAPAATAVPPTTTAPTAASTLAPTPTRAPTATNPPSPPAAPTPATLPQVGEKATGQGFAVTLHAVQDPAPTEQYSRPKDGFRWVAADVTVENTGSGRIGYNPLHFRAKAADNREYNATVGGPAPRLQSGEQQPGEASRGWVTVEVPTDARLSTLTYDPTFGRSRVVFDLSSVPTAAAPPAPPTPTPVPTPTAAAAPTAPARGGSDYALEHAGKFGECRITNSTSEYFVVVKGARALPFCRDWISRYPTYRFFGEAHLLTTLWEGSGAGSSVWVGSVHRTPTDGTRWIVPEAQRLWNLP